MEVRPLLAVAEAQLTLAVPAAGKHSSLTSADESVVSSTSGQENFLGFQSWEDKKANERRSDPLARLWFWSSDPSRLDQIMGPPDQDYDGD